MTTEKKKKPGNQTRYTYHSRAQCPWVHDWPSNHAGSVSILGAERCCKKSTKIMQNRVKLSRLMKAGMKAGILFSCQILDIICHTQRSQTCAVEPMVKCENGTPCVQIKSSPTYKHKVITAHTQPFAGRLSKESNRTLAGPVAKPIRQLSFTTIRMVFIQYRPLYIVYIHFLHC